jgi:hypothetical protein
MEEVQVGTGDIKERFVAIAYAVIEVSNIFVGPSIFE